MIRYFSGLITPILCLFLLVSCYPESQENFIEVESHDYVSAKQKMREGNFESALQYFLKVIEDHSYSPESHLEVGVIYLQQEGEPIMAIYHFNQYLQQKPNSREAPLVEELILSAKKQFATALPGNPFKKAVKRMALLETIAVLKRDLEELNVENVSLKHKNAELRAQLGGAQDTLRGIFSVDENQETTVLTEDESVRTHSISLDSSEQALVSLMLPEEVVKPQLPASYVVQPGDSLYAISLKFYGDAEHIQSIFQANRNVLKSVNDLRPGQVLSLPR